MSFPRITLRNRFVLAFVTLIGFAAGSANATPPESRDIDPELAKIRCSRWTEIPSEVFRSFGNHISEIDGFLMNLHETNWKDANAVSAACGRLEIPSRLLETIVSIAYFDYEGIYSDKAVEQHARQGRFPARPWIDEVRLVLNPELDAAIQRALQRNRKLQTVCSAKAGNSSAFRPAAERMLTYYSPKKGSPPEGTIDPLFLSYGAPANSAEVESISNALLKDLLAIRNLSANDATNVNCPFESVTPPNSTKKSRRKH